MTKPANKISRTFRLDRQTIALMETYARENGINNTAVVELAIKRLCRQSATPATQQDVAALAELIRANQAATIHAIENQPVPVLEAPKKESLWQRLWR